MEVRFPRAWSARAYTWIVSAVVTALALSSVQALPAHAAGVTLYLYPNTGTYTADSTFGVNVSLNTGGTAVNAVSGVISFPKDRLEVASISKSGSIISLWVQEPTFSNSTGTINFEGIVFNPGFSGDGGKILGITFRAKSVGDARVTLSQASALANDGSGTDVLASVGGASYSIVVGQPTEAPTETPTTSTTPVPTAPTITSTTYPDSSRWYTALKGDFAWELQQGVTGMSYLFDKHPDTIPDTRSEGAKNTLTIEATGEGEWYLHVREQNAGGWGATGHYRVAIDTTPPNVFSVTVDPDGDGADARPIVYTNATDDLSGVVRYEISVGGVQIGSAEANAMTQDEPYRLPFRTPGSYELTVRALDAAGNERTGTVNFTVEGFAPPVITDYPDQILYGEALTIGGQSYPNARIDLQFAGSDGRVVSAETETDETGSFRYTSGRRLKAGDYQISARVHVDQFTSDYSEPVAVHIEPSLAGQLADLEESFVLVIRIALGMLLLFVLLLVLLLWQINRMRAVGKRKLEDIDRAFHQTFQKLRHNVIVHVDPPGLMTKKSKITAAEAKLADALRRDLEEAERKIDGLLKEAMGGMHPKSHMAIKMHEESDK